MVVTVALFVGAAYVLSDDLVFRRFVDWANDRYSAFDRSTPEGVDGR